MKTVNILGTEYTIVIQSIKDNKMFDSCDGYCDWSARKLYIRDYSIDKDDIEYENIELHMDKTIRHEIIHAFLFESGLFNNAMTSKGSWATNEEMVDWFAIQYPKIKAVYENLRI